MPPEKISSVLNRSGSFPHRDLGFGRGSRRRGLPGGGAAPAARLPEARLPEAALSFSPALSLPARATVRAQGRRRSPSPRPSPPPARAQGRWVPQAASSPTVPPGRPIPAEPARIGERRPPVAATCPTPSSPNLLRTIPWISLASRACSHFSVKQHNFHFKASSSDILTIGLNHFLKT